MHTEVAMSVLQKIRAMAEPSLPLDSKYIDGSIRSSVMTYIQSSLELLDNAFRQRAEQAKKEGPSLSCRSGCSACCYDYAMVSATEFAPMLDAFRKMTPEDQQHVRDQNARWIEAHKDLQEKHLMVLDSEEQGRAFHESLPEDAPKRMIGETTARSWKEKTPCSFLKDGKCMVYSARPLACRGHNLWDKRGPSLCEKVLYSDDVKPRRMEMSDVAVLIVEQFRDAGLPVFPIGELNTMLERWLNYDENEQEAK